MGEKCKFENQISSVVIFVSLTDGCDLSSQCSFRDRKSAHKCEQTLLF